MANIDVQFSPRFSETCRITEPSVQGCIEIRVCYALYIGAHCKKLIATRAIIDLKRMANERRCSVSSAFFKEIGQIQALC